jgi:hypothetical protein
MVMTGFWWFQAVSGTAGLREVSGGRTFGVKIVQEERLS